MLDDAVCSALTMDGPATFATTGPEGPHLVATWQSYLDLLDDHTLAFPAGGYNRTEANLRFGSTLQMVIGSKGQVPGPGVGFRLTGTAVLETDTPIHDRLKVRFPWCRAAVVMTVTRVERILG